jgi:hypothetical protein
MVSERRRGPIRGTIVLLGVLPSCGAVLGLDEKEYVSEGGVAADNGGPDATPVSAGPDAAPVTVGPDAAPVSVGPDTAGTTVDTPAPTVVEDASPPWPDAMLPAAMPLDSGGCIPCPICQTCGPSGTCVPARAGSPCALPHATASCDGFGTCATVGCSPGYLDCTPDPGCETARSLAQCSSCGSPCAPNNVVHANCNPDGTCSYDVCAAFSGGLGRYLDCDGNAANGCESSPDAIATCGACGASCATRCGKAGMTYQCKGG